MHDQEEAFELADRVVVMNQSRIEQIGTPDEIHDHPATPFVYQFLDNVNRCRGHIRDGHLRMGDTEFFLPEQESVKVAPAVANVRPHEIKVHAQANGAPSIAAIVMHVNTAGPLVHLELELTEDGSRFAAEMTKEESRQVSLHPGVQVFAELKYVRVFAQDNHI